MRKTTSIAFVLALIIAGGTVRGTAWSAEPMAPTMPKWEYRVLTKAQLLDLGQKDLAVGLNKLGEEGWELTAVDSAYIFKRTKQPTPWLEEIKRQIALAKAELAIRKDRVAWSERMLKKGFLAPAQLEADKQRLRVAEAALEKAKRQLKAFSSEPKQEVPEKDQEPRK